MSAFIERDFDFQGAVYFQDAFLMNVYSFTLTMEVNTDSIYEQNIAMDRIKYLVYEVFENCIFVHDEEKDIIKKYKDAGLKTCATPEEPYDQIISLLLMLKLDAVCEDRLKVINITFTSKLSDDVRFKESILTAQNVYGEGGWYNDSTPNLTVDTKRPGKEKIVKIKHNEWKECGLIWKEKKENSTEIVFSVEDK